MNKGCFNKMIFAIISLFTGLTVLVAAVYIGYVIVLEDLNKQLAASNEELKARSETIADFSRIPPGYIVTKAIDVTGVKIVLANYPYSGQIIGIIDPGWVFNISGNNGTVDNLESQIKNLLPNFNRQDKLKINNFDVEQKDTFKAMDQDIPYMRVFFSTTGEDNKDYKGIIGILKNQKTNKNFIIIALNQPKQYRQITTERFFQYLNFPARK